MDEQELKVVTLSSIDRYFSPEKETLFVAGLHVSYTVANFQLEVLTTLLTSEWNMALFSAVCITSIQNGLKKLLVIPSAYLADKYVGHTKMLLLSALSYCVGLFVWHYLVGYPDPEQTVKPKMPIAWIYLSLVLMTLGQCSYDYYKERKPVDSASNQVGVEEGGNQAHDNTSEQERANKPLLRQYGFKRTRRPSCLSFCRRFTILPLKVGFYMLAIYRFRIIGIIIASWLTFTSFDIAIALAISLVVLCIGKLCFYPFERPEESPLSLVFRVLVVAYKRGRCCHTPHGTCEYYYGGDEHTDHIQNTELQLLSELHISANTDDNIGVEHDGQQNADLETSNHDDCAGGPHRSSISGGNCGMGARRMPQTRNKATGSEVCSAELQLHRQNGDNLHYGQNKGESGGDLEDDEQTFEPQNGLTDQFWLLNKAALYDPSTETPRAEADNGRLCTINHVKEAKKFLRVTRLSLIFVMYGLMESVSSTFFVEQADKMDASNSYMEVPVQVIIYSSHVTEYLVRSILTNWNMDKKRTRFHGAIRLGMGMVLSVICFMIAFLIEQRRLKALKNDVVISAFWLIPQCSLLGAIRGFVVPDEFFNQEMPKSFSRSSYGSVLAGGVIGIGKLLSLLLLLIVYTWTKSGAKSGWIGHDLNSSHIDYYYVLMAVFSAVCCIIHGWVVYTYCRHQRSYYASTNQIKRQTFGGSVKDRHLVRV